MSEEEEIRGVHSRVYKEDLDERVDEFFKGFPDPIDWADKMARQILVESLKLHDLTVELTKSLVERRGGDVDKSPLANLAWAVSVDLGQQLRDFRGKAREDIDKKVKNKVDYITKKLRDDMGGASFLAELVRERAAELDDRGCQSEANALRDAANILNEEF